MLWGTVYNRSDDDLRLSSVYGEELLAYSYGVVNIHDPVIIRGVDNGVLVPVSDTTREPLALIAIELERRLNRQKYTPPQPSLSLSDRVEVLENYFKVGSGSPGDRGPMGPPGISVAPYFMTGLLHPARGNGRQYLNQPARINRILVAVGTPAVGGDIVVDVRKNSASLFAGFPESRPVILAEEFTADAGDMPDPLLAQGDYLTVDVLAVGSSYAGSDLTVHVFAVPID